MHQATSRFRAIVTIRHEIKKFSVYFSGYRAMLLVGRIIGFGKNSIKVMPALAFALLRFVIAVTILAPQYWKPGPGLTKNEWPNLFAQAFFGTFLLTLCMLYGVQHASATAAGAITSTIPAAAAILPGSICLHWLCITGHSHRQLARRTTS